MRAHLHRGPAAAAHERANVRTCEPSTCTRGGCSGGRWSGAGRSLGGRTRRCMGCASPMRYVAPREGSRASVASTYVGGRSAAPLLRRAPRNSDACISLTFAANSRGHGKSGDFLPRRPASTGRECSPAPSRRARTRALRLKAPAAPRHHTGARRRLGDVYPS